MKKTVFIFLLATAAGGILFAQTPPETSTVSGTLGLSAGRIVVKSGTLVYYTRGLERLIGFIDGLKDGAQVTIEGYVPVPVTEGQTERFISPVKLTLNGKSYEVGRAMAAPSPGGSYGPFAFGGGRGRNDRFGGCAGPGGFDRDDRFERGGPRGHHRW